MKCINCGNDNQPGSKFCRFCGSVLPAESVAAPHFAPVPPAYPPVAPNSAPGYPPVAPNPVPGYPPVAPNSASGYPPVAPNPVPGYVPVAPNSTGGFAPVAPNSAPIVPPYSPNPAPGVSPMAPIGEMPAAPAPKKKASKAKIWIPIVAGVVVLLGIVAILLWVWPGWLSNNDVEANADVETLNDMTPEELYAHTQELMSEATSFSSETTQEIVMEAGGSKMTMNQSVISKKNGYDLYVKSENDMGAGEMEVTYVDGIYYENNNGHKIKTPISVDEMERYYSDLYGTGGSYSTALLNIPGEWLEGLTFIKDGDHYTVTIIVPAEEYTELVGKMGIASAEFTEDVEYVIYFSEEGELEKAVTTFDFDVMGVSAHCVSVSVFELGDVTITPPADADTYTYYG